MKALTVCAVELYVVVLCLEEFGAKGAKQREGWSDGLGKSGSERAG